MEEDIHEDSKRTQLQVSPSKAEKKGQKACAPQLFLQNTYQNIVDFRYFGDQF